YKIERLPEGWKELQKYILQDGRTRLLSFVPPTGAKAQHLHPNHPLVKKAITYFRANIWSRGIEGTNQKLNKVTCKVVPSGKMDVPHVLLYVRALAINKLSQPLVEEVDVIGGRFEQGEFLPVSDTSSLHHLDSLAVFNQRASSLVPALKKVMKMNEKAIQDNVEKFKRNWKDRLNRELKEVTSTEKTTLLEMIKERAKEIDKTIIKLSRYEGTMFEDQMQYSEDIRLLKNRQEYLKSQLEGIPKKIEEKYTLKGDPLVNVVALCFLIPEEMIR
ncbi:hypothetical protein, partial [Mesotoga sp. UBA5847]|uniref:hypothetical protein n=1 Tax=Mesotoga sp. UBA5847 TaxID=1946859 RepID=UPI0025DE899A